MNLRKMIDNVNLNGDDLIRFEEDIKSHQWNYIKVNDDIITGQKEIRNILRDIYIIRFKLNLSSTDIATHLGLKRRAIEHKLVKLGWQRTNFESQAIASKKRDYKAIKSKSIETMLQNNTMSTGSEVENYIRHMINQLLTSKLSYDVIVGVNNRTILNGLEIDIPIIIIKDKLYKFAIEVNGSYWHKDEIEEKRKEEAINKTDYKYFTMHITGSLKNSKTKINKEIDEIVNQIIEEVEQTSFFNAI